MVGFPFGTFDSSDLGENDWIKVSIACKSAGVGRSTASLNDALY